MPLGVLILSEIRGTTGGLRLAQVDLSGGVGVSFGKVEVGLRLHVAVLVGSHQHDGVGHHQLAGWVSTHRVPQRLIGALVPKTSGIRPPAKVGSRAALPLHFRCLQGGIRARVREAERLFAGGLSESVC